MTAPPPRTDDLLSASDYFYPDLQRVINDIPDIYEMHSVGTVCGGSIISEYQSNEETIKSIISGEWIIDNTLHELSISFAMAFVLPKTLCILLKNEVS